MKLIDLSNKNNNKKNEKKKIRTRRKKKGRELGVNKEEEQKERIELVTTHVW